MSILDCKKENVDNISEIWLPDNAACLAAEEKRQEEEWLRKKNGLNGKRPSELGIDNYIYGQPLHPKFYEGRTPPQVPIDSMENLEWYADQLHRAIYGFEYNGQRITGDHYWFLNFFPFLVAKKDKRGRPTKDFEINFPYYSVIHDYVFKVIEQAHFEGKGIAWMAGRGVGKTYIILSILAKIYHLKPTSHCYVSASQPRHADEAFSKLTLGLDSIAEVHPTLALNRLIDTKSFIESGQEVVRDGVKTKEGPRSKIQKIVYGDNPGITRGSRPDAQLIYQLRINYVNCWKPLKLNELQRNQKW